MQSQNFWKIFSRNPFLRFSAIPSSVTLGTATEELPGISSCVATGIISRISTRASPRALRRFPLFFCRNFFRDFFRNFSCTFFKNFPIAFFYRVSSWNSSKVLAGIFPKGSRGFSFVFPFEFSLGGSLRISPRRFIPVLVLGCLRVFLNLLCTFL